MGYSYLDGVTCDECGDELKDETLESVNHVCDKCFYGNPWRPASEKPKERGAYLIISGVSNIEVGHYNIGVFISGIGFKHPEGSVRAWAPIPDGWQEFVEAE